jgi:hypothetical protein
MVSSTRTGHRQAGESSRLLGLPLQLLLVGLFAAGCGTDRVGLPEVDPGVEPSPMKPDAGPRPTPTIDPPDAMAPPDRPPMVPDGSPDTGGERCEPPPAQPGVACSFGYFTLKRSTPELVLVFDRSSAMLRTVPGTMSTRWNEMVAAVEDNLGRSNAAVLWGLKMFPTTTGCDVTPTLDVPVALSNRNAMVTRIRGNIPMMGVEGSPLEQGIKTAAQALLATPPASPPNPRYLVLATDGIPSCPAAPSAVDAAAKALQMQVGIGLRTYVIGTANPMSPQHRTLNDLALSGGEARPGEQKYFPALDKAQMLAALDEITGRMSACVLTVNTMPPYPDFVALNIGNKRIERDANRKEGWNWGGGSAHQIVHLYGEACDLLRKNPLATAELVLGCPGYFPPPPCSGGM